MRVHELLLLEIIHMKRATEKGLMISFIGFFAQVFFQFISLSYMQYLCCLQATDLLILVGILLIYMGRFEFSQKHQDMAKYSIILFIVVQIGLFVLPWVIDSPEIMAASGGLRIGLVFLINLMLVYHLTGEKNRKILKGALVLGIIGACIFAYFITPILRDDNRINEELRVLLGKDETDDALLTPTTSISVFKEERKESKENITVCYDNISNNYNEWQINISILEVGKNTIPFDRETASVENVALMELTVSDIEVELESQLNNSESNITGIYTLTKKLHETITVNLRWVIENENNILNKSTAIGLIDERLDNIMEQNKFKLIIVLPTLLFGFIYFQTHKKVKEIFNENEEEMKKKLTDEEPDEEEEEDEEDEEVEDEEEKLEKPSVKEIKRKKSPPKGKKKGAKIMDLDEIRKKYNK